MRLPPRVLFFPVRYAGVCALIYGALTAAWIGFSTQLASLFAKSVEELTRIEKFKGYGFAVVTTLLFFAFLYAVFKKMASDAGRQLASEQELIRLEREAVSGLIASTVAHDFSNLLTTMRLNLEKLRPMLSSQAGIDSIERMDLAVTRLSELTSRLRKAGKQVIKSQPAKFILREAVDETLGLLQGHDALRGCRITVDVPDDLVIQGYPVLIHQVLLNLIINAAEATQGRGIILVAARRSGDRIVIEVHDNGPGVAFELRERIFEAFYTSKQRGSGLGLKSVRSCTEMCGGEVGVGDSHLGGALFRLSLPDLELMPMGRHKMSESLNKTSSKGFAERPQPSP